MTQRRATLFALLVLAAGLSGCGKRGVPVTGTVKLGGAPISAAIVALEPEPGSGTTGAGAVVRALDGRFEVGAEKNLTPGKYVVRVSPMPINTGTDLKTAPPQFQPWETKAEIGPESPPLELELPRKKK